MADVFDPKGPDDQRERLWELIKSSPNLDWLLLTKRPQLAKRYLPDDWGSGYPNVWLGVTSENQETADERIPILLDTPAVKHFVTVNRY
jgi:protein gp37